MFEKLKELGEFQKLQKQIKQKEIEVEKNGIKVKINGTFEILSLKLNPELTVEKQEELLKNLLNEGREKIQKEIAKNFAGNFF